MTKNQSLIPFLRPASKQSGSLQKVHDWIEEHQFLTNWKTIEHNEWKLPATNEPHCWCGIWKTVGCLNSESHAKLGYQNTVYVKQFQRSCYRGSCKICYRKWIAREANKATKRINTYSTLSAAKPIHVVLSIPASQYNTPVPILRKRMSAIIKNIELKGAMMIFHPFRFHKNTRQFYYSPHFHLIGFGYIQNIAQTFSKYGWFIKYLGVRESVFQTVSYLMSHCGIRKGNHTVTWLGNLSYSKLKIEKEPPLSTCPCCGEKFIEIYYEGLDPIVPPDKIYEGLVDYDGWYQVKTYDYLEPRYDYAPTRDLNELLKGIATAN